MPAMSRYVPMLVPPTGRLESFVILVAINCSCAAPVSCRYVSLNYHGWNCVMIFIVSTNNEFHWILMYLGGTLNMVISCSTVDTACPTFPARDKWLNSVWVFLDLFPFLSWKICKCKSLASIAALFKAWAFPSPGFNFGKVSHLLNPVFTKDYQQNPICIIVPSVVVVHPSYSSYKLNTH